MATGDRKFTRIPPESTGDRIQVHHSYVINYNSKSAPILIGDEIACVTSLFTGIVVKITEITGTTGILWVTPDITSEDLDVIASENIQINAGTVAIVASGYPLYSNVNKLVGWNNSSNGQFVDEQGSAYMRFQDGSVEFDAFGKVSVSQSTPIGSYIFDYDELPYMFTSEVTGSASISHDVTVGSVVLDNTTGATDEIKYTTNLYHPYIPGVGQKIVMTVACGDTGKANLERSWGYFDDNDGLFFRQTSTGFEVVVRSSVSGSPVETVVLQDDFNLDKVDGTANNNNLSRFNLDTSKDVVYWISLQWLGAGTVAFGCYGNGQRITLHKFNFSGLNAQSYMRTACLPIRIQQTNTGLTGSSSEFRLFCAQVSQDGQFLSYKKRLTAPSFSEFTVTNSELYLSSFRNKLTINTIRNKRVALLDKIKYSIVKSGATDTDDRIILKMFLNATLTTPSWTSAGSTSGLEYDSVATLGTHTILLEEWYLKGTGEIKFSDDKIDSLTRLLLLADGSQPTITFTAQNPVAANTALAYIKMEFNEVEV